MNSEHQFIAALADNPKLLGSVTIGVEHFVGIREARVFATVCNLIREGKDPEQILVAETLDFETNAENSWLGDVVDIFGVPYSTANTQAYEHNILENYRRRRTVQVAGEFLKDAQNGDMTAVTRVLSEIHELEREEKSEVSSVSALVGGVLESACHIDKIHRGDLSGVLTGISKLDDVTGGFQQTDLIVIAARTSVGKTAFMLNIAANVTEPCGVISGEQSSSQIIQRLLAKIGNLSAYRMRTGRLDQGDFEKLVEASAELSKKPIYIADKARPSIDQVERWGRQMAWEHGIKILFVDYLQLLKNPAYSDKRLQVDDISKRLKGLALELEIPVVCLAQLNRNAASDNRTPKLSDLKESGAIEEDADQVILLYRDENYPNKLTVDLQKQRNGGTVFFDVGWNKDSMRVTNES